MTLTSIKQNGVELSQIGGIYQAPGFNKYYAKFAIGNYNAITDDFFLRVSSDNGGWGEPYEPGEDFEIEPNLNSQQTTYHIYLCDSYECDILYAHTDIEVNLTNYAAYQNGKLYISNVTQGGEVADFDTDDWTFSFNDKQDVRFHVYGTNLIDDAIYSINVNYITYARLTGSELENGIDVVYRTNASGDDLAITFTFEGNYVSSYCYNSGTNEYCNGTDYNYISYTFDKVIEVPAYTGNLIYTNYKDNQILSTGYYDVIYGVNSNYHNQNNSLSYHIDGDDFENKNYQVMLNVTRNEET